MTNFIRLIYHTLLQMFELGIQYSLIFNNSVLDVNPLNSYLVEKSITARQVSLGYLK